MISKTPDCEPWGQELFGELSAWSKQTFSIRRLWRVRDHRRDAGGRRLELDLLGDI
jgi:hypothetical protein